MVKKMLGAPEIRYKNSTLPVTKAESESDQELGGRSSFTNTTQLLVNSQERPGIPIRYPASAFFNINSIDRYASATNPTSQFALITQPYSILNATPASNYNMSLGRNLLSGYFHRLTVTDANLQWNIPTINSQNYIFKLYAYTTGADVSANVAIRQDYYTMTELAAELQDAIVNTFTGSAVELPALTVTWSDAGNGSGYAFRFATNDPDKEIAFLSTLAIDGSGVVVDSIPGTSATQANRAMFKFYTMIGITSSWIGVAQKSIELIATPTYPTLIYTSYIDIISNKLSQYMKVKDSETAWAPDTAVITRIYLTNQGMITAPTLTQTGTTAFDTYAVGSRAFILNYTPQTPKNIKWDPAQAVNDFDIRVVDEFGDVVPWSQYTPYSPPNTAQTYFTEFFEFQLTVLASET